MPGAAARRGIWALGIAVVLITAVVLGLPIFASTQIVRDSIAHQMSAWSGYRVQMGEAPEIQVWPSFRAILHDVTLSEWTAGKKPPVIESDRAEIDLSALAALRGEVVFTKLRLVRPIMRVEGNGTDIIPSSPTAGRLASAVSIARALIAADPAEPNSAALPNDPFGTVEFEDGKIVTAGEGSEAIVTGLAGSLSWPALNRPASLSASGVWHGENVSVEAVTGQPLLLLAEGNAPVALSIEAAPLTTSFEGVANISENPFVDGQLELSSPSLRRLLAWSRPNVPPGASAGAVALAGRITGGQNRLKFENTEITLDGNTGSGVLDVSFGQSPPGVSGTLAFDSLDLLSLLSAFGPWSGEPGSAGETLEKSLTTEPLATRLNVDLRLSVASARVGSIALSEVAATAQVKDGLMAFDISDAAAFGGTLQFGVRVDRTDRGRQVELRIVGDDVDGAAIANELDVERVMPRARGSFSLILKGRGAELNRILESAEGSVSAAFGEGSVEGIDLAAFLSRRAGGGFFALSEIADGQLPISGAELKATISGGVARINEARVRSGEHAISLGGLVPLAGRGLALSGTIAPAIEGESGGTASFFVGGSWSAPFVAPIAPSMPPG